MLFGGYRYASPPRPDWEPGNSSKKKPDERDALIDALQKQVVVLSDSIRTEGMIHKSKEYMSGYGDGLALNKAVIKEKTSLAEIWRKRHLQLKKWRDDLIALPAFPENE